MKSDDDFGVIICSLCFLYLLFYPFLKVFFLGFEIRETKHWNDDVGMKKQKQNDGKEVRAERKHSVVEIVTKKKRTRIYISLYDHFVTFPSYSASCQMLSSEKEV